MGETTVRINADGEAELVDGDGNVVARGLLVAAFAAVPGMAGGTSIECSVKFVGATTVGT